MKSGRRLAAGLLAAAGIVAGHALTYSIAVTDPHERLELLAASGHGYWSSAVVLALAAAVGAIVLWLSQGLPERGGRGLGQLMSLQCGGFVILEFVESAFSTGHMAHRPLALMGLGLVCQVLVAAVSTFVLRLARAVAERRAPARSRPRPHVTWSAPIVPQPLIVRAEIVFGRLVARGPPLGFDPDRKPMSERHRHEAKARGRNRGFRAWADLGSVGPRHDPTRRGSRRSLLQIRCARPQRA